jgi:hypothetical protein
VTRLAPAVLIVVLTGPGFGSRPVAVIPQEQATRAVLAPGQSHHFASGDLTFTFESVHEDSRCPAGVSCIWAGDAHVRLRVTSQSAPPSTYTLHTNDRFDQETFHGDIRVRLVALTPEPTRDGPPKPDQYRVTLEFQRKSP